MKPRPFPEVSLRPPLAQMHVTSAFGRRANPFTGKPEGHPGVDLRAAQGTEVFAAADGTVVQSYFSNPPPPLASYGNRVVLAHGDGVETSYAHLVNRKAVVGSHVKAGEVIGWSGSTGASTAPHLHWELRIDGVPHDPMAYLAKEEQP